MALSEEYSMTTSAVFDQTFSLPSHSRFLERQSRGGFGVLVKNLQRSLGRGDRLASRKTREARGSVCIVLLSRERGLVTHQQQPHVLPASR